MAASLSHRASLAARNATIEKLRYIQGASWDVYRVCLPNTRVNIIGESLAWVDGPDGNRAQILLLTAVAGAGKSTIAHTIAQRCAEKGQLVSSIFFDRETEGRNNPSALFSTIAADLGRLDRNLAAHVTASGKNGILINSYLPKSTIIKGISGFAIPPFDYS
jgi:Mrp family chromosome partitioning ATPase